MSFRAVGGADRVDYTDIGGDLRLAPQHIVSLWSGQTWSSRPYLVKTLKVGKYIPYCLNI